MSGIIVVDDQPSSRRVIARLAAAVANDVEVIAFANPLDALAHAADEAPDLLITDLKMAPIEGDELIRRFRRVPACAAVPVIVVTAHAEEELRSRAMRAGVSDYFLAPVDHREFKMRSRHFLAMSRRRKLAAVSDDFGNRVFNDNARVFNNNASVFNDNGGSEDELEPIETGAGDAAIQMLGGMLKTVNAHLAQALIELENARMDLQILSDISEVGAVFVDRNLLIRRFTPLAASLCRLSGADVGKSFTALETSVDYADLVRDFRRAIEVEETAEACLPTRDGAYVLVRMAPYRRKDGVVDGAAITFKRIAG